MRTNGLWVLAAVALLSACGNDARDAGRTEPASAQSGSTTPEPAPGGETRATDLAADAASATAADAAAERRAEELEAAAAARTAPR